LVLSGFWQVKVEYAPFAYAALYPDSSAVSFYNPLGNRKTQPCSLESALGGRVNLVKALKDAVQLLSGDANTLVHHGDLNAIWLFLQLDLDHATVGTELDGVV
jgi:hypothetical protein